MVTTFSKNKGKISAKTCIAGCHNTTHSVDSINTLEDVFALTEGTLNELLIGAGKPEVKLTGIEVDAIA